MPRTRHVLVGLLLVGLFTLAVPVAALANGGGSAGDQQYVDPVKHKTSSSTTTSPSSGSSNGSSNSGSSGSSAGSSGSDSSAPTTSSTLTATPAASTSTTPVATTAATTSTSAQAGKQLPRTGYDDRIAAGLGMLLVLGGFGLRRRTRGTRSAS